VGHVFSDTRACSCVPAVLWGWLDVTVYDGPRWWMARRCECNRGVTFMTVVVYVRPGWGARIHN
jgi:hypothetical protein